LKDEDLLSSLQSSPQDSSRQTTPHFGPKSPPSFSTKQKCSTTEDNVFDHSSSTSRIKSAETCVTTQISKDS
jgi:hypothetical protein